MNSDKAQRTKLTPPDVARRWGVSADKVRAWIESGELRAIDLAKRRNGRPRYRIDIADVLAFEQARQVNRTPSKNAAAQEGAC